jgi:signal transduction histidine kinase
MRRWVERLDPAVRDWWPVVLVLLLDQAGLSETGWSDVVPLVPGLVGLALAVPLRWRRSHPLPVVLTISLITGLADAAMPGQPPFAAFVALLIACFALAQHASLTPALVGVSAPALLVFTMYLLDPTHGPTELIFPAVYIGGAWGGGRLMRRRQEMAARMAGLVATLEAREEENARLAAETERHRIAREVHDVVAHSLGVILIQAEAAQELLARGERVDRPVGVIQSTSREALEEMRRVLGAMRADDPSSQPGLPALPDLVERFRQSGLTVTLALDSAQSSVPSSVGATTYRLVQEALTNVIRHAHGASAQVRIFDDNAVLCVQIRDDGNGVTSNPRGSSGHGLAGMRERVARLGGELVAGPLDGGGFGVDARLPADGDHP